MDAASEGFDGHRERFDNMGGTRDPNDLVPNLAPRTTQGGVLSRGEF
jgi:hypothetical protein